MRPHVAADELELREWGRKQIPYVLGARRIGGEARECRFQFLAGLLGLMMSLPWLRSRYSYVLVVMASRGMETTGLARSRSFGDALLVRGALESQTHWEWLPHGWQGDVSAHPMEARTPWTHAALSCICRGRGARCRGDFREWSHGGLHSLHLRR